jgi:hypothetical protein
MTERPAARLRGVFLVVPLRSRRVEHDVEAAGSEAVAHLRALAKRDLNDLLRSMTELS